MLRFLTSRWVWIPLLILIGLLLLAWLLLPWWAIRYVEKHDREWINRDITIEGLVVNPFAGAVTLKGVRVTEPKEDTTFASFHRLYANLAPWSLLKSHLHVQEVKLDSLYGRIVQNGSRFNFSDLLELGGQDSGREKSESSTSKPFTFEIHNVQLNAGAIDYEDQIVGSLLQLDSIKLQVDSFTSAAMLIEGEVEAHQKQGGWLATEVHYEIRNGDFNAGVDLDTFAMHPLTPYVTQGIRLSYFDGTFDADFQVSGNTNQTDYLATSGRFDLMDFQLADPDLDTLLSLGAVHLEIDSLDTRSQLFDFGKVLLEDTYTKFEYLPNGDNFSKLLVRSAVLPDSSAMGSDSTQQEVVINTSNYYASPFEYLAVYIYDLTRDYIFTTYSADSVAVHNFNLKFYDYTLEDPFYMDVSDMTISAGEIAREDEVADFKFAGTLNRTGTLDGDVLVSRSGAENMEIDFELNGLFLNGLSPYSRFYTAHPFLEGVVTFTSTNQIENYYLNSTNRLFIEQVKVGDKRKTRSGYSMPMKLAIAILRDLDGNIDLKIPIEGPLNDPNYRLGKVIWQVVKNIFVKAGSAPFRLLANAFKVNEKDLKNIYFENGQVRLEAQQIKALNAIAKVLDKKPELQIELLHLYNREYELDAIALLKAKHFYLSAGQDSTSTIGIDSLWRKEAAELPNTDSAFLDFVRTYEVYDSSISVQENIRRYIGEESLSQELEVIVQKQKDLVQQYLAEEKGIDPSRFLIKDLSGEDISINQVRPRFTVQFVVEEEGEAVAATTEDRSPDEEVEEEGGG